MDPKFESLHARISKRDVQSFLIDFFKATVLAKDTNCNDAGNKELTCLNRVKTA